jgi:hypothetical protein
MNIEARKLAQKGYRAVPSSEGELQHVYEDSIRRRQHLPRSTHSAIAFLIKQNDPIRLQKFLEGRAPEILDMARKEFDVLDAGGGSVAAITSELDRMSVDQIAELIGGLPETEAAALLQYIGERS